MIAQDLGLSIARKCTIMGVSRSGFYDWRKRELSKREIANASLDSHIQRVYHEHAGRYGYRRICDDLRDVGLSVSLERVRRVAADQTARIMSGGTTGESLWIDGRSPRSNASRWGEM